MTADTTDELLAMADAIGMRRAWLQHPGQWSEHFDLTLSKRKLAVAAGAVEVEGLAHTRAFLRPRQEAMRAAAGAPSL